MISKYKISRMDETELANVAEAFNRQAKSFDDYEEHNPILIWMRSVIHRHMMKYIKRGDCLLELNAGTGIDAVFFAQNGLHVHAIDISSGMVDQLRRKISAFNLSDRISFEQRSFTDLTSIQTNLFDHVFSDFGGINCVSDPRAVIREFDSVLKPGGFATFVAMPPICPWELFAALKGNFGLAIRRLRKNGTNAQIDGVIFKSYYFSPNDLIAAFGSRYKVTSLCGIASVAPPPYHEQFPKHFPRLFDALKKIDERISTVYPFNSCADHFILTMQFCP